MSIIDALYVEDTLGLDPAFDKALIDSVGPSPYNLAVLAFLHTRPNNPYDLYFNETQMYQKGPGGLEPCDPCYIQAVAKVIQQLQLMEVRVILSMGPQQSDYDNIANDVPTFCANLQTMAGQLGLNGFDFDYEGIQDSQHAALVASLVNGYAALESSPILTAAPFGPSQDWWAGVLQQTGTAGGSGNNFSWWNVQFYEGNSNPYPSQGAEIFGAWESAVAGANAGIANPSSFLVPGASADPHAYPVYAPETLTELVANIYASYPDLGGAFVWNYGYIASDVADWAQAPYNGIGGQARRKSA